MAYHPAGHAEWRRLAGPAPRDGTLTCEGTLCGKLGAPPPGVAEVHVAPHAVTLAPFQFAADMQTFAMAYVRTAHADSPRQNTYQALAGREVRRTCLP